MAIPLIFPTSRKNALASFRSHIKTLAVDTNPAWTFETQQYQNTLKTPVVSVVQKGLPDLGATAFDDDFGGQQGSIRQMLVEINIADKFHPTSNPGAEKNVMLMRERVWYAMYWAGSQDPAGVVEVPRIELKDYDTNPLGASTGSYVYWPSNEDNTWYETPFMSEESDPNMRRIQILVRLRWVDIRPTA